MSDKLKTTKDSTDLFDYGQLRAESDTLHAKEARSKSEDRSRKFFLPGHSGRLNSLKKLSLWIAVTWSLRAQSAV
jgi:hypothetical protein